MDNKLKVDLRYYDETHRNLLKKYSSFSQIENIVNNSTITIPKSEFLTYLLFKEQKNHIGFKTYSDFNKKISKSYSLLERYIKFNDGRINANFIGKDMDGDLIQRVGVAISLCIANKIHNLNEADWEIIPEIAGKNGLKTLDYNIASDGNLFIQVESKGSAVENNELKPQTISNHKSSIDSKKKAFRETEKLSVSTNTLNYGFISSLDHRANSTARCWMLDPIFPEVEISPEKYRLLARMYYYWSNLRVITPMSFMLGNLLNRLRVIEKSSNYGDFDGLYFLNRNNKKMRIYKNSFQNNSNILSDKIIGKILPFTKNRLFYIGYRKEIYNMIINQKFKDIIEYKCEPLIRVLNINCRIRKDEIYKYDFNFDNLE